MFVLLNSKAGGGNAIKKWNSIKNQIDIGTATIHYFNGNYTLKNKIIEAINTGETNFTIAGGDGTINLFLNLLIPALEPEVIKEIKIGAICIGSSNDFHKPLNHESMVNNIPIKINFKNAALRDVGCISYHSGNHLLKKYFLINASIGVTAEANHYFNSSGFIIRTLKKISTKSAINYSALRTIYKDKSIELKIIDSNNKIKQLKLANLAITKSPHISGNITMDCPYNYQDGLFNIYFLDLKCKIELIKLLNRLQSKNIDPSNVFGTMQSPYLLIEAEKSFKVEFDGEIIITDRAEFSILHKGIRICSN